MSKMDKPTAAPTGTTRCSCPSRSEPIQHDILCPLHAPTGTPTDRKTLAEVYAHEYAYNLHPDEPSLAALFLKFANDCTSRFTAAPTGTGEGSDWIHEVDPVLCGLKYIAESPSQEYGGFHPEAVKAAKNALAEIITLRSQLAESGRKIVEQAGEKLQLERDLATAREEQARHEKKWRELVFLFRKKQL